MIVYTCITFEKQTPWKTIPHVYMCKYSSQCSEADHFYEAHSGSYTDINDKTAPLATTLIEDCYATINE